MIKVYFSVSGIGIIYSTWKIENPSSPNRSQTYDPPITMYSTNVDALPLSNVRLLEVL